MGSGSDVNPFLCNSCEFTLASFIVCSEEGTRLRNFLYDHGVILRNKTCPSCGSQMTLNEEDHVFRCWNRIETTDRNRKKVKVQCKKYVSQFKLTFFENHKLSPQTVCRFVAYWVLLKPPRHDLLRHELDLSHVAVVDWSNYLREVCTVILFEISEPIGGVGKTVEIDEAKIGKRKYNRGRIIEGNWVFGGIERETKRCFLVPVPTRGQETLLPIIQKYVLPGTTVISDCWKSYNCLQFHDYQHLTVNHRYNFIDPDSGAHTQTIERLWREVRGNIPRYGNRKHHLVGHLAEFIFKRKYSEYKTRIHHIFRAISHVYNGISEYADRCEQPTESDSNSDVDDY